MQAKLDSVIITLPHGGHFLSPPVCCRRHVGRLYPWITPASGVHSHPWFLAIASVSSHFYWKGLALVILRHWEEMKSPSFARVTLPFTLRTMICQDKGMGHEVALEFCPDSLFACNPASLLFHRLRLCVRMCMCHIPNFKSEEERKKLGPNDHFSLVSPLAVDSHRTGTNMSQQLLLRSASVGT